ncbi:MAG: hypothetical protein V2B18_25005, partial [Pseudomonadota bacterium]
MFRDPLFHLILQAIGCMVFVVFVGGTTGRYSFDTYSFTDFQWSGLSQVLSQTRPFAYPLLVASYRCISPDFHLFPQFQFILFVGAVIFFYESLKVYGFDKWTAFWAATPLFYQRYLLEWTTGILSDLPALSMALVALGFLLRIVTRNGGVANWAGLTLSLLLTYHTRAAYLFLIPLTPILGFALLMFRESGS